MTAALPDGIPRANGEPVFAAPWESRAFGLAAAYLDSRGEDWARFRHHLMDAIARLFPRRVPRYLDFACGTGRITQRVENKRILRKK